MHVVALEWILYSPLLVGGFKPSEKYEFVSWDDDIPNIWEHEIHVPNHQPGKFIFWKNKKLIQVISTEESPDLIRCHWDFSCSWACEISWACDENEHPRSPGV